MINIVIPMAGIGRRFIKAGYKDPKPLISINGIPMIKLIIHNLKPTCDHRFIFICQKSHIHSYNLRYHLTRWAPNSEIIEIEEITEGAACTVLKAIDLINNDSSLMIANSDQYLLCSIDKYLQYMTDQKLDGLIMTMKSHDPKWSFIGFDTKNNISKVAEKEVISNEATVGIYNFSRGRDFVQAAIKMIENNVRSNGEFYVAPVFNHLLVKKDFRVGIYPIGEERKHMYGLDTPEDLDYFINTDSCKAIRGLKEPPLKRNEKICMHEI